LFLMQHWHDARLTEPLRGHLGAGVSSWFILRLDRAGRLRKRSLFVAISTLLHCVTKTLRKPRQDDSMLDKLRLARTEGVGPVTWRRLIAQFVTADAAIDALPKLARDGGRATPPKIPSRSDASRELDKLHRLGGKMVFSGDTDYPPLMALLTDPPPVLSFLGDMAALSGRAVGVVGARNASSNGQRMAEMLATDLASQKLVVVSGMARGIDAAAHRGALHVGLTVAAVAGGLDQPYPPEHASLQAQIAERGAVLTEAPFGTAPQSRHFPRRNRLIAGLSLGLVVVEAAPRSGSLITARLAQEAGREIFAVPGSPLDARCRGSNDLIRQGAHLIESAEDVLANLPDDPRRIGLGRSPLFARAVGQQMSEPGAAWLGLPDRDIDLIAVQSDVVALLSPSPTDIDDLIRHCTVPPAAIMAALTQLELALRVEFLPGNRVCRVVTPGTATASPP
jgi:DNA processing protein